MDIKKNLNRWFAGRRSKAAVPDQALKVPAVGAPPPAAIPAEATVEPEIAAVIAAVLAVEVKVFMALQGRSFTFSEGDPQGWSEWGRLLIRPYQGVR